MQALLKFDYLDTLHERFGVDVKDIWAELESNQPLACEVPKFKEMAMEAVERIVARQKEQANGANA